MPELSSGRCGQGGLKYVLTILAWKGPQRQGVELCSVSSCSIQASHRPSYTPGLLKHGQKWALLTALSAVPQIPAALSAQQLLPSQHSPSSCIAQGGIFCKWNCSPQLVCPAEAAGAAGISGKAGHQPGHGACWAEMNTQNSLVIEGRDLLGICNSLCGRGRLWDWMEVKTQKSFLGPGAVSVHLPCFFLSLVGPGSLFLSEPIKTNRTEPRGTSPSCSSHSPYSGSLTNSEGSLGKLIPQGLLALTRNWYWQPGDRSSMTRYVSKVEATDCCQTCEPVGQREGRGAEGNTHCVSSGLRLSLPCLGSTLVG